MIREIGQMIPAYIINLKNEQERRERTVSEMMRAGYSLADIHVFEAVLVPQPEEGNGTLKSESTSLEGIHPVCRMFCTAKMIACAQSHRKLASLLSAAKIPCTLVLEDDVRILAGGVTDNFPKTLEWVREGIETIDTEWDIILLFHQGPCGAATPGSRVSSLCGSTAAYLVSHRGAQKLERSMVYYHADLQRNIPSMRTYMGPPLFSTFDPEYCHPVLNYQVHGQNLGFWLGQELVRVPGVDVNLRVRDLPALLVLFLLLFVVCRPMFWVGVVMGFSALSYVAYTVKIAGYRSLHFRFFTGRGAGILLLALLMAGVASATSETWVRTILLGAAYAILLFFIFSSMEISPESNQQYD